MVEVRRVRQEEEEPGLFLPNRDLVGEPEHTVCEDAAGQGGAPLHPVGQLAFEACGEGGAVDHRPRPQTAACK